jgi:hypothetical protein
MASSSPLCLSKGSNEKGEIPLGTSPLLHFQKRILSFSARCYQLRSNPGTDHAGQA